MAYLVAPRSDHPFRRSPNGSAADWLSIPDQRGTPGLRWYAALWLALLALSTVVVLTPNLPIAWSNPLLSVATEMLAAVVGLAVLHLGTVSFNVFGCPADLLVRLAFGTPAHLTYA